jgi:hypothetical protein
MPDPTRSESSPQEAPQEPIPLGQRLYDNMFLLLILGLAVVFILFTGWGMWEILTLPPATLP